VPAWYAPSSKQERQVFPRAHTHTHTHTHTYTQPADDKPPPLQAFNHNGCPNCEEFLELAGHNDNVTECTSQVFEGLITLADPTASWVAKWQRLDKYVPGTYAVKVTGIVSFSFRCVALYGWGEGPLIDVCGWNSCPKRLSRLSRMLASSISRKCLGEGERQSKCRLTSGLLGVMVVV